MDATEREATLRAGIALFDSGRYLASHELFEELWEASEGEDSEFYKGLIQAAVALHHFEGGNLEGAARLYSGHRRCLASFQPLHAGVDVARFLEEMRRYLAPALHGRVVPGETGAPTRPRLSPTD